MKFYDIETHNFFVSHDVVFLSIYFLLQKLKRSTIKTQAKKLRNREILDDDADYVGVLA